MSWIINQSQRHHTFTFTKRHTRHWDRAQEYLLPEEVPAQNDPRAKLGDHIESLQCGPGAPTTDWHSHRDVDETQSCEGCVIDCPQGRHSLGSLRIKRAQSEADNCRSEGKLLLTGEGIPQPLTKHRMMERRSNSFVFPSPPCGTSALSRRPRPQAAAATSSSQPQHSGSSRSSQPAATPAKRTIL